MLWNSHKEKTKKISDFAPRSPFSVHSFFPPVPYTFWIQDSCESLSDCCWSSFPDMWPQRTRWVNNCGPGMNIQTDWPFLLQGPLGRAIANVGCNLTSLNDLPHFTGLSFHICKMGMLRLTTQHCVKMTPYLGKVLNNGTPLSVHFLLSEVVFHLENACHSF